jgi:hypothetical protein
MFHSLKIKNDTLELYNKACAQFITEEGKKATQDEVIKKALGVYLCKKTTDLKK